MLHILLAKKRIKVYLVLLGLFYSFTVLAQTKITGKVIGADDKQAVIGASVKIKGTTKGTVTDVNGVFSINASPSDVLSISYVGYQLTEVTVGSRTNISITLSPSSSTLNEVVVTGYTTQVKKEITSSVAIVDMKSAKNLITSSSEQLLQGQASGVNVVTSGAPGGNNFISVRGISSFGSVAPLYVVDGVQTNSMSDINPNDIESLVVLKDAGSAAIYGVSGGNGVVVVTTKKGKGKPTISYDANFTNTQPIGGNPFHILSGDDQAKLTFQVNPQTLLYPNGKVPDFGYQGGGQKGFGKAGDPSVDPAKYVFDPADVTGPPNDYLIQAFSRTGTDWFHEVFKPAYSQSHSLSASGSNDKNAYFVSLQYLDQKGTLINTYKKRYSTRVNTIFNVKDNIRIGENIEGYFVSTPGFNNQNEGNTISEIYRIQPTIPVYDIMGNYGGTWDGPTELGNASNPVANQQRSANNGFRQWNMIGSVFGEVDLFKHLTARTSINITTFNFETNSISLNAYNDGESHGTASGASEASGYTSNLQWSNTLVYNQIFGKHSIKLLGGFEQSDFHGRIATASANNLFSTDPNFASVSNGSANVSGNAFQFQPNAKRSMFGKLDYIYAGKYILSATIRRDGFSGFLGDQRYGNFPALSLGWRVSEESFMKQFTWLNDLKLRASIGTLGSVSNVPNNNGVSLYGSSTPGGNAFNQSGYALNGTTLSNGFFQTSIGNPATHWESDKITNAGFDATLFNSSFDLSFEIYKKSISGLLFKAPLPATAGAASSPYINIGNIENVGFDVSVTYHGKVGSDFRYDAGINFTHYKNLVVSVPGDHFDVANSRIGTIVRNQVGQDDGAFYG
jgi:TonB-linked SusC/RagA family outer membrane protein